MDTNIEKEKHKIIFDRLILAKQIYYHGVQHSVQVGPFNKMIAILNYHNAVEIVLRNILLKYEIRTEKQLNIEFENMISEIDNYSQFKSTKKKIPNRQELRDLNQLRNWIQHKAVEPESSTMDYWKIFTRQLLVLFYKEYFDEGFDSITCIKLIGNLRLQKLILKAEEKLGQKDNTACANYSKLAFEYGVNSLDTFLPTKNYNPFFDGLARTVTTRSGLEKHIENAITKTNLRINEVQNFSVVISTGIDLIDYKKFIDLSPNILLDRGEPQFYNKDFNDDETKWIFHFVVDSLIKWEYIGLKPSVPKWAVADCDKYLLKN
ncbi:MAG: hypothetical protein M0Q21_10775 [Ignavibacteriaceae bacterium]|nr:hypothetical protein [Ignavibacteriaceae bacterium]